MLYNKKRLRNRILQALYRPRTAQYNFLSPDAMSFMDELDRRIEEKLTPMFEELF